MALKLIDAGADSILSVYAGAEAKPTSWTLRLFTDNATLADDDVVGTRTAATGGGYADITLYPEGGSAPAGTISNVGGITQIAWAEQTFTFTGALTTNPTIYGYMIFDNNNILLVEELTTNFTPANNGDTYSVTAIIKIGNGTPT
jgi:hypothetical protein